MERTAIRSRRHSPVSILLRTGLALAALGAGLTCTPTPPAEPVPAPTGAQPEIRIGLATGVSGVVVSAQNEFAVLDQDGRVLVDAPGGTVWTVSTAGGEVAATSARGIGTAAQALSFAPRAAGDLLAVNGRPYRGRLVIARDRGGPGLTVVNQIGLEDYLAGVVSAEMGRRDTSELEALAAQAVVSRTYAIRNLGKRAAEGFDLYATVTDQVYGGVAAETALGWAAVRQTAGQVLVWDGTPIDAFFYSTCAGRTASGPEVFVGADRPYLVSVRDTDPSGRAYCRISPRYRWRERWSGEELSRVMRQSLPGVTGTAVEEAATVRGVRVVERTPSDRVARIAVVLARQTVDVDGPAVRQVLHPVGEPMLRSAAFTLHETRTGSRLDSLVADGAGAGHAVGFCQWGAVGRARAGQKAAEILAAYFPGTTLTRAY